MRSQFVVRARRSEGWWSLDVPEVPGAFSQVRNLDDAGPMAREAIALMLDLEIDEVVVLDVVVETNGAA